MPSSEMEAVLRRKRMLQTRRMTKARQQLIADVPFFGRLLLRLKFGFAPVETCTTDIERIFIDPDFLDSIDDQQLEFVLLHEILHCALGHPRRMAGRDQHLFNIACDIVVNSIALEELSINPKTFTIQNRKLMDLAPDGSKGSEHTAEEIYDMLTKGQKKNRGSMPSKPSSFSSDSNADKQDEPEEQDELTDESSNPNEADESSQNSIPSTDLKQPGSLQSAEDEEEQGSTAPNPQHPPVFSKPPSASPNPFVSNHQKTGRPQQTASGRSFDGTAPAADMNPGPDSHEGWEQISSSSQSEELFAHAMLEEAANCREAGNLPSCMERVIYTLSDHAQADWLSILSMIIQQSSADYTFSRPDRRVSRPFILPGYRDAQSGTMVEKIWVVVDASGSILPAELEDALSEIRSMFLAIDEVSGYLSFFDIEVSKPVEFHSLEDLKNLRILGGGGTRFDSIFQSIDRYFEEPPAMIIILTDGFADFPPEEAAQGIPVVWLMCTNLIEAPWGMSIPLTDSQSI